jgi:oligopeptidase A
MTNPLLTTTDLPLFDRIKPQHILPAVKKALAAHKNGLEKILKQKSPYTWQNLMQPLEELDDNLQFLWSTINHLHMVISSPQLRHAYNLCLPKISLYRAKLGQNQKLYATILSLSKSAQFKQFNTAQKTVINNTLRDFRLSGISLPAKKRQHFLKLQTKLAALLNKFGENVLDSTSTWQKIITDPKDLTGISETAKAAAKEAAEHKKLKGWLFTLHAPSYEAIMTYADKRDLRREVYLAYVTRAAEIGPHAKKFDNSKIMLEILKTRKAIASLLGFKNYAEVSLVPKMAKRPKQVLAFLENLARRIKTKGKKEFKTLEQFAQHNYGVKKLEPWDLAYYSEKLRQQKYAISQDEIKRYFPEPQVLAGLFKLIELLFKIKIKPIKNMPVWHKNVKTFGLYDQKQNLIAKLYLDLYARVGKQGGAWMDNCRSRRLLANHKIQLPVAYVVCNFTPPLKNKNAFFTHNEVDTLFHEFGHALQHLLTKVDYASVAGTNGVPWDTVEFPSQFMENWCWQKPVLKILSKHEKTGKPLPNKIQSQMLAAKNMQIALQTLRQLEFALFDFLLHIKFDPKAKGQIQKIIDAVRKQIAVIPTAKENRLQHSFLHIFAGEYAAGYYSYKWAEVMAADAFAKFEEQGLFNQKVAQSFLKNILETGGAIDPGIAFKNFRGREPNIKALLKAMTNV